MFKWRRREILFNNFKEDLMKFNSSLKSMEHGKFNYSIMHWAGLLLAVDATFCWELHVILSTNQVLPVLSGLSWFTEAYYPLYAFFVSKVSVMNISVRRFWILIEYFPWVFKYIKMLQRNVEMRSLKCWDVEAKFGSWWAFESIQQYQGLK